MGDSAEFEKLSALEARLAAALDRVAGGVTRLAEARAARADDAEIETRIAAAETARAEAEAQSAELTERVAALEARLSEAQDALTSAESSADPQQLERLSTELTEANTAIETARDEVARLTEEVAAATRARDEMAARVSDLEAAEGAEADTGLLDDLSAAIDASNAARAEADQLAQALAEAKVEQDALKAQNESLAAELATAQQRAVETTTPQPLEISDEEAAAAIAERDELIENLQRRVKRWRNERNAAREERDAARDVAAELTEKAGAEPDARVIELRADVRRLTTACDTLSKQMDALREANFGDARGINQALLAQNDMLRAARRSEAAELARILEEMESGSATPDPKTEET